MINHDILRKTSFIELDVEVNLEKLLQEYNVIEIKSENNKRNQRHDITSAVSTMPNGENKDIAQNVGDEQPSVFFQHPCTI